MSTSPPPKPKAVNPGRLWLTRSRSLQDDAPLAEAAIAKDMEEEPDPDPDNPIDEENATEDDSDSDLETLRRATSNSNSNYSMVGSYRRPSYAPAGGRATIAPGALSEAHYTPTKSERKEARRQERSLLRDNNMIPPKHPQAQKTPGGEIRRRASALLGLPGFDAKARKPSEDTSANGPDSEAAIGPTESSALLGDPELPYGGQAAAREIDQKWETAVAEGKIQTTWQREAKVIGRYSAPLILTFLLQYSLTVASIFTVGHLGKSELAAVSLASMTANITGYSIYQGLSTSLDTLCAQAYGSGRKKLVGLQTQRMVYFLWTMTLPIGVIWLCADLLLMKIVPEKDVARLAGLYLKVVLIGAPGYAAFEAGKRYVQAQGLFSASLYVLLICAPLNAFMNWLFVWQFRWGFVGAPIAVAITDNLLPVLLVLYVRFVAGSHCWPGLTKRALKNWIPMVKLAIPGFLMVEAEVLAFEILTLAASYFGTAHLAAQSVLSTLTCITFNLPFPVSIAASTRIANLIGATLTDAAKTCAKVAAVVSVGIGIINVILLSSLKGVIPRLFTSDAEVIDLVAATLPLCAAFQLFDALTACCNGILRGLGRQEVGGYVQMFCYYAIAMPISMGTAFGAGWGLFGLWAGVAIALFLVGLLEGVFIFRASWEKSVRDAQARNERL